MKKYFIIPTNLTMKKILAVSMKIFLAITILFMILIILWLFWYDKCFFPDDSNLHEKEIADMLPGSGEFEVIESDLAREIASAKITNPVTSEDMKKIDAALKNLSGEKKSVQVTNQKENSTGFYFYHNPYDDSGSPMNQKVTVENKGGKDQKNSIILKNGTILTYQLAKKDGERFLDFYYVAPEILEQAENKLFLSITSGNSEIYKKNITAHRNENFKTVENYKPKNLFNPKVVLYHITHARDSMLLPDCGWRNEKIKLPSGAENISITFTSENEESFICIGTPRIYRRDDGAAKRANVIFLLFDQLHKDDLDIYEFPEIEKIKSAEGMDQFFKEKGPSKIITPSLDRKAGESVIFNGMHSNGSLTMLSVSSLWTSRPFSDSGLPETRYEIDDRKQQFYDKKFDTLPSLLLKKGFVTSQISNNAQTIGSTEIGLDFGFEESYDYGLQTGDKTENFLRIYRFLKSNRDRNFFLYAHVNNPHPPNWVPMKYFISAMKHTGFDLTTSYNSRACLEYLDFSLKKLFTAMEKLGLDKNTIVIISADHGSYYYYNLRGKNTPSDAMIKKRKEMFTAANLKYIKPYVLWSGSEQYLYENHVNIPFVIIPPKGSSFAPGMITSSVQMMDVAPTLLEILIGGKSGTFEGKSFSGMLISKEEREGVHSPFIPIFGKFRRGFVYEGRYKYWRNLKGLYAYTVHGNEKRLIKPEFLFDLKIDPYETENLAANGPDNELLVRMRNLYNSSFPEFSDRNLIQIMPLENGSKAIYTVKVTSANGSIVYPETEKDDAVTINDGEKSAFFDIIVTDKLKKISFETKPNDALLMIEILRNGTLVSTDELFTGADNLAEQNPIIINTSGERTFCRAFDTEPVLPLGKGSVRYVRVPLEYWLAEETGKSSGITSTKIKEQLKSWGYIQ